MAASGRAVDVLFVSYSGLLGGAERLMLSVATGVEGEAAIACPPGALSAAAADAGLRTLPLRERRLALRGSVADRVMAPVRIAAQAVEVRRALRRERPRVLVGWNMRAGLSCALANAGSRRPFVFGHHDFLPGPSIARLVRAAARRADAVTCVSRAVAEELGVPGAEAIHPGVDAARFADTGPPPTEPPRALLLGAIVDWKRPGLALEAVALAAKRVPDLRLTVAGAPIGESGSRLLAELRERAKRPDLDGRVEFAGQSEARDALARSTCLLHCSDREPFGIVLIEALASGRPAVAPNGGGAPEVVTEDCGRLYPPGDAQAAAEALREVLADPEKLGEAGRERAASEFSEAETRRRFNSVLDRVTA